MEEGAEPVQSLLVSSLETLTEKTESAIKKTREDFNQEELIEFLTYSHDYNHGILKLFTVTPAYAECMKKVGVQTKEELKQLWEKYYEEPKVKAAVESLLTAESNFTDFVAEIEEKLKTFESKLTINTPAQIGQQFPKENTLLEIPSGQPISPEKLWKGSKFTLLVFLRLFG